MVSPKGNHMEKYDLQTIIDGLTESHKSTGVLFYTIVMFLHLRGVLTSQDLQVLKEVVASSQLQSDLPHAHLYNIPVNYFLSLFDNQDNDKPDIRSILRVIDGGKKD